MSDITPMWDGDTYPVIRFPLVDDGAPQDLSRAAIWFDIWKDGAFLIRRPGSLVSPVSSGIVECFLKGRETDWDGAGAFLTVYPIVVQPFASNGQLASNLLLNPSFDTDANVDGIADSWSLGGARTATWAAYANDEKPAVIRQGGFFQLCTHATISPLDPDYIQQGPSATINPGDRLSVGCWHRIDGAVADAVGGVKNNNHAIFFRCGAQTNSWAQFEIGRKDWYFVTGSVVSPTAETSFTMGIDGRGTKSSNRYDDAFAFIGAWRKLYVEPFRLRIKPRMRIPRTSNTIAGIGSFERDSNADGLPDGWAKYGSPFSPTITLDRTPANVDHGSASLKVICSGVGGTQILRREERRAFKTGETWRASVRVKTSGTLTGTAPFIQLSRPPFETYSDIVTTNIGQTLAAFTTYSVDLTFSADADSIHIQIGFASVTGTLWIDDVQFKKV